MGFTRSEDWAPQGVASLEPAAMTALRVSNQSVSVVASAGAGKTEFLAQKAAYLLETGTCRTPQRILAISFKRDAAKNLADRVRQRCHADQARRFDSLTFDAFTKSIVDRFSPAIPEPYTPAQTYSISFPGYRDWDEFMERQGVHGQSGQVFARHVSNTSLPISQSNLSPGWKSLVDAYWAHAFSNPDDSLLAFSMLNRLAEYLIRSNDQVRRALHLTYPFVFLDEFQDTTSAQYDLLTTAFFGSTAKLTAVGDDKQRIMGWAGAMGDGFERLADDFQTTEVTLLSNWRSHADLVKIQHVIAQAIDKNAAPTEAKAQRYIDGDIAAIWFYQTKQAECEGIVDWIAKEIEDGIIQADNVAILVRMRADDVEAEFAPVFKSRGLTLRNVARQVGEIAIQDLLVEELTAALLPLLRLGAHQRSPENWRLATKTQQALRGIDAEDENGGELIRTDLEKLVTSLRESMALCPPSEVGSDAVIEMAINFVGESELRRAVPAYGRDRDYARVKTGFKLLLQECTEGAANWSEVLDRFEGVGQTPLMTVHKSKGLEFHTVVFLGLDSKSWWSLKPTSEEELKSFFVAFTRAKQRAFFTQCAERGGTISWLENLLVPAGVVSINGPR